MNTHKQEKRISRFKLVGLGHVSDRLHNSSRLCRQSPTKVFNLLDLLDLLDLLSLVNFLSP